MYIAWMRVLTRILTTLKSLAKATQHAPKLFLRTAKSLVKTTRHVPTHYLKIAESFAMKVKLARMPRS
jgi:hypothetical protein